MYSILLLFVAVASANPAYWKQNEKPEVIADLGRMMDRAKPLITKFIIDNQLDPLNLPDVSRSFWVVPPSWPLRVKASLELHTGTLNHLSDFRRIDDAKLTYRNKVLTVAATVKFDYVLGLYDYYVKVLRWKHRGDVTAEAYSVYVNFILEFDMNTYTLTLRRLSVDNIDELKVSLRGNAVVEWLTQPINEIVMPLFKRELSRSIEKRVAREVQEYLDEINQDFPAHRKLEYLLFPIISSL